MPKPMSSDAVLIQLPRAPTLPLAFACLGEALSSIEEPPLPADRAPAVDAPPSSLGAHGQSAGSSAASQLTRLEVEVDAEIEPAHWLAHQLIYPRVYFSNQHKSLRTAGVGAAERIGGKGVNSDESLAATYRSLAGACPRTRFYGGMRFDSEAEPLEEWSSFGGSVFVLPLWELQVCDGGRTFLACHIRWWPTVSTSSRPGWDRATRHALHAMQRLHLSAEVVSPVHQTLPSLVSHHGSLDAKDWETAVRQVLHGIDSGKWSKVGCICPDSLPLRRGTGFHLPPPPAAPLLTASCVVGRHACARRSSSPSESAWTSVLRWNPCTCCSAYLRCAFSCDARLPASFCKPAHDPALPLATMRRLMMQPSPRTQVSR